MVYKSPVLTFHIQLFFTDILQIMGFNNYLIMLDYSCVRMDFGPTQILNFLQKNRKQAVAELGQTQVKLKVINEIVVEVRS